MKYISLFFIFIATSYAWEETILINRSENTYTCKITKESTQLLKDNLNEMCTMKKEDPNLSEEISTWVSDIIQVLTDYTKGNREVLLDYVEINVRDVCVESPLSQDQPDQWTKDALETFCHFYTGTASFYRGKVPAYDEPRQEYIQEEYEL